MSPTIYAADPVYGIEPVDITPTSWDPLEIAPTTRGRNFRRLVTTAVAVSAGAGVMVALSLLGAATRPRRWVPNWPARRSKSPLAAWGGRVGDQVRRGRNR